MSDTERGKELSMGNTGGGQPAQHSFPSSGKGLEFTTMDASKTRKDIADTGTITPGQAGNSDNFGVKDLGTT